MRKLFYLILLICFTNCSSAQNIKITEYSLLENLPNWLMFKIGRLTTEQELRVISDINPYYLEADFNGDNNLDIALIVENTTDKKKGILVIHGKSFKNYIIGAGSKFGNGGDDFKWMDTWKVYREPTVLETLFKENYDIAGQKTVELKYNAISVASSEGASNLIIFDGKQYVWLHTGS